MNERGDMALKLYNTLTRKKEEFIPIKEGEVGMYTCGPTVYDHAHIGNFRAYVFEDVLKRYLKYRGYEVRHVMNLTDVDDKTIAGSKREGVPLSEFTARYSKTFFEDLKTLNIEPASVYPRATEHINEMVDLIEKLLESEIAYHGGDGSIYFDISRFEGYGNLSKLRQKGPDEPGVPKEPEEKTKLDEYARDGARDFALWKAWTPKDGDVFWDTKIGKGRPGWHIECSAMSMKHLGDTFDIHAGGVDLVFPHHENEIAQSVAATGKKFVNYWLHNEHLLVEGKKMSKSLGNFYTLRDLLDGGHGPNAIRYLLLSSHYRQKLNFTFKRLDAARNTVQKLSDFMDRVREGVQQETRKGSQNAAGSGDWNEELHKEAVETREKFDGAMDDDLNTPRALACMFELVNETNRSMENKNASKENLKEVYELFVEFDSVLKILGHKKEAIPGDLEELIKKREDARKRKDWAAADRIRERLKKKGIIIEDTPDGPRWKNQP
jgi:cysteinyl-tRNA synthetase